MIKELRISDKIIEIFYKNSNLKNLPVVILNTYEKEGQRVFDKCTFLGCKEFILVAISNLNWNDDMTPWFVPRLNKSSKDCLGKADEYIELLTNSIMPKIEDFIMNYLKIKIEYFAIAGYSLGGLFSIYSTYKTNIFTRVVSASGSFWFPKFVDFIKNNNMLSNIKKIYFSIGNKESKTKNELLSTVETNTIELTKMYNDKGIETRYEINEGSHFKDTILRMAKGIKWILD